MAEQAVGEVTHYYGRIEVAIVKMTGELQVGDTIHILGKATDFHQPVSSMQIERQPIQKAEAGQMIGLKVSARVQEGDIIYRVSEG